MLIASITWLSVALLASCQPSASEAIAKTIAVKRSIQADESLKYSIDNLFPAIEKDPHLHFDGENDDDPAIVGYIQSMKSQILLKPSINHKWTINKEDTDLCTDDYTLNQATTYLAICDGKRKIHIMRADHLRNSIEFAASFKVDDNEQIISVTSNSAGLYSLDKYASKIEVYLLVQDVGKSTADIRELAVKKLIGDFDERKDEWSLTLSISAQFKYQVTDTDTTIYIRHFQHIGGWNVPGLLVYPKYSYLAKNDRNEAPMELIYFGTDDSGVHLKQFYTTDQTKVWPQKPGRLDGDIFIRENVISFGRFEVQDNKLFVIMIGKHWSDHALQVFYLRYCKLADDSLICTKENVIGPERLDIPYTLRIPLVYYFSYMEAYKIRLDSSIKTGQVYLLTRKTLFEIVVNASSQTANITQVKLHEPINIVSWMTTEKEYLYFVVSAHDYKETPTYYMMEFDSNQRSTRLFQDFNITADVVVLLFRQSVSIVDYIVTQKYDSSTGITAFSEYSFGEEDLIIKPNSTLLKFQKNLARIEFAVTATCIDKKVYNYNFTIVVYEHFDLVKYTQAIPTLYYYKAAADGQLQATMPFDSMTAFGTNPDIKFEDKKSCYQSNPAEPVACITVEKKNTNEIFKGSVKFKFNQQTEKEYISDLDKIKNVLKMDEFMLLEYQNGTFSIFESKIMIGNKASIVFISIVEYEKVPDEHSISAFFCFNEVQSNKLSTIVFVPNNASAAGHILLVKRYVERIWVTPDFKVSFEVESFNSGVVSKFVEVQYVNLKYISKSKLILFGLFDALTNEGLPTRVGGQVSVPLEIWKVSDFKPYKLTVLESNIKLSTYPVMLARSLTQKDFSFMEYDEKNEINIVRSFTLVDSNKLYENLHLELHRSLYDIMDVQLLKCVVFDEDKQKMRLYSLSNSFELNDPKTNIRQFYDGILVNPAIENGNEFEIVDIINDQGLTIFVWFVYQKVESSEPATGDRRTKNLTLTIYDFRAQEEDPLQRYLHHRSIAEVDEEMSHEEIKLFHTFQIDRSHKYFAIIAIMMNNTILATFDLYPSEYILKANISDVKFREVPVNIKVKKSDTSKSSPTPFSLVLTAIEQDPALIVVPLVNKRDLLAIMDKHEGNFTIKLDRSLAFGSPVLGYREIMSDRSVASGIELFKVLPIVTRFDDYTPMQSEDISTADFEFFMQSSSVLMGTTKQQYILFKLMESGYLELYRSSIKKKEEFIRSASAVNIDIVSKVRNIIERRSIVVSMALLRGDYIKSDLEIVFIDYTDSKRIKIQKILLKEACKGEFFRFVHNEGPTDRLKFTFQYGREEVNGTTWVSSVLTIYPNKTADRINPVSLIDSIFKDGFTVKNTESKYYKTFQLKLSGKRIFGVMKPSAKSTLSYFFFENSNHVGIIHV